MRLILNIAGGVSLAPPVRVRSPMRAIVCLFDEKGRVKATVDCILSRTMPPDARGRPLEAKPMHAREIRKTETTTHKVILPQQTRTDKEQTNGVLLDLRMSLQTQIIAYRSTQGSVVMSPAVGPFLR